MKTITEFPHAIKVLEKGVWIPMKRGDRLAARIWMPENASPDNPVPALLEYIPYRKRDMTRGGDEPKHSYFAGHGYASVRVDMAGAGAAICRPRPGYFRQFQSTDAAVNSARAFLCIRFATIINYSGQPKRRGINMAMTSDSGRGDGLGQRSQRDHPAPRA